MQTREEKKEIIQSKTDVPQSATHGQGLFDEKGIRQCEYFHVPPKECHSDQGLGVVWV